MERVRRTTALAAAAAVALTGAAVWQLSGGAGAAPSAGGTSGQQADGYSGLPHTLVQVSPGGCGAGWSSGHTTTGLQVFDISNSGIAPADVQLVEPASGAVVGEVEGLAPNRSRPLLVRLAAGSYAFRCLQQDVDAATGPTVKVTGAGTGAGQGTPAVVPVTQQDLIPAALAYQHWVAGQLPGLVTDVDALHSAVASGDLAGAKQRWLTAHLAYERLGAAYGAFGDVDDEINGPRSHDTGFHGVEYGLWHQGSTTGLEPVAAKLLSDVRGLEAAWPKVQLDPAVLGVRAHEIVENAIEFELSGRTDYGSDSNLATVGANLDGTTEVLTLLRPLLISRVPMPRIDAAMAAARAQLTAAGNTPLGSLTQPQREKLNAVFGDLVEQLAPVASVLEVRRTQ
ncbi:EfeM/EfeO family lipoprotein [Streptacidiphilus melanogenes]|uniref:EfeM/EfeO family lipoprotein n=1 Tax=Streptacidiphilus melanogenes TaxID=411235 RepID=UPI001364D3BD|nr:EfeM/EfeO family lipoprotein [Streptacidiphilus melanogenes]